MTDEEKLAEEYANKEWTPFRFHDAECDVYNDDIKEDVKNAFLAGLKAGRPKWHKVADGDLPESLTSVLNQDGEKVVYNDYCKLWRYDDADENICATPIAWCEIPKYTEE